MPEAHPRVTPDRNLAALPEHLRKYCQAALDLGASRAIVVKTAEVPVSESVAVNCRVPRCYGYGTSANCPPHAPTPAELREYLKNYEWAVFFVKEVPTEFLLCDRLDPRRREPFRQIHKIASQVEAQAFYDGHYLAFGLAAGSCRMALCGPDKTCQVLEGGACRFPGRSRPSMEAVGIDVYQMVARAGWEIHPIGGATLAAEVPCAVLAGLVVVQ